MYKKAPIVIILLIAFIQLFAQFNDSVTSIKQQINQEADSLKVAELYLKLARLYRSNNVQLAEKYALQCLNISERNNYLIGIAKAKLEMVDMFELLKPEFSYNLALDAHSIFAKKKDSIFIIRSLNSLANVVYTQGDYDKALEIYYEALKFAEDFNDLEMIPALLNNIGICIANKKNYAKAKQIFTKALQKDVSKNKEISLVILGNIGETNVELGIVDSVLFLYDSAKQICNSQNNKKELAWLYNNYSNYYKAINNLDSAEYYARKALKKSKEVQVLNYEHSAYENLRIIFMLKNNPDSAIRYFEFDNAIKDSISRLDKLRSISLLTIKADLEKNMEIKELKNEQLKNRLYASVLFILFILTLIIFLFRIYKINKTKMQLEKGKIQLEKQYIEEKLIIRNREITAHILNLVSKNKLIESLIQQLNIDKPTFKKDNQQKVQKIINELRLNLNKDIWKEFEIRFKDVQPQFYNNLLQAHPSLTPNELKLCAFLKLNLASKEIAIITLQNIRSIEKGRERLRKKVGINNQDISLSGYLSQF